MTFQEIKRVPYAKNIVISPNGQTMIAMSGRTTRILRMADDTELAAFRNLQGAFYAAFSPDGETVAVKTNGPHIGFYSLKTFQPTGRITTGKGDEPQNSGFCFSPDGKFFYNLVRTPEMLSRLVKYDTKTLQEVGSFFAGDRAFVLDTIRFIPEKAQYLLSGFSRSKILGVAQKGFALWLDQDFQRFHHIPLDMVVADFQYLSELGEFIAHDHRHLLRLDGNGHCVSRFFACPKKNLFYGLALSFTEQYLFCALSDGFIVFSTKDFSPLYSYKTKWPVLSFATTPDDKNVYVTDFTTCTMFEIHP